MSEELSKILTCGHCYNIAPMKIIGNANNIETYTDPENGPMGEAGPVWLILDCPACHKNTIVTCHWNDGIENEDDLYYEVLFPIDNTFP